MLSAMILLYRIAKQRVSNITTTGELYASDSVSCDEGYYFEDIHDEPRCDPISGADPGFCDGLCNPCEVLVSTPDDTTPDPTECGKYFISLTGGNTVAVSCVGPDFYYDYKTGVCQTEANKCFNYCDDCQAYCIAEGYVKDPADCNKYYYCNLPALIHASCPAGEQFATEIKECSNFYTCTEDCLVK